MTLQGWKRRVFYVGLFEFFAIVFSSFLLAYFAGGEASESAPIAVAISVIAIVWNYVNSSGSLVQELDGEVRIITGVTGS